MRREVKRMMLERRQRVLMRERWQGTKNLVDIVYISMYRQKRERERQNEKV